MLTSQEQMTLEILNGLIAGGSTLHEAVQRMRVMLRDDDLISRVVSERQEIIDKQRVLVFDRALADPEELSGSWYPGSQPTDIFWPKLRSALEADPDWAGAVRSLDETSTEIVSLLADPRGHRIGTRGLVLGHVQSGKTASFTATIAKAADAGYRCFIVLSGVHNALRRQTQVRLDAQLCEINPTRWVPLTTEHADFGYPVRALPLVAGTQLKLLAVVKKNVTRLARLREWLTKAHEQGGLDNCPVLIIDDEADQASPNAHKNPELDRTRINEEIVGLLRLPKVAYVGYTATPFANILANPSDVSDIYPRSFIYPLPKPDGYFGSEELFPAKAEDELDERSAHDMIRLVDEDESRRYIVRPKAQFEPSITPALADAIRWFVMATAARRVRTGVMKHSSMLVHTTMRVQPQLDFVPEIRSFLSQLESQWRRGQVSEWESQWIAEQDREPSELHGHLPIQFDRMHDVILSVLSSARVVADNSSSEDRLIYTDEPATVIAVGGNTLSRGLTLNGLISSFFMRSSNAYDSVLQMGRWFGYRNGYEDLPRIWMTESLAGDFQFLAGIEADIRQDIARYVANHMKPSELAVRIALHPRMQVTSRLKMHWAVPAAPSFSESRPQTTYFSHRDVKILEDNLRAARRLVKAASTEARTIDESESYVVMSGVSVESILEFMADYDFHPSSEMSSGRLEQYIRSQLSAGALETWNLAIVTRKDGEPVDLSFSRRLNMISRSRLDIDSDGSTANIGTLMSRRDRLADLGGMPVTPKSRDADIQDARNATGAALLLLYPIDRDSMPAAHAKDRRPLMAAGDLVGVAVVFPRAAAGTEVREMIQVDLSQAVADDQDEEYNDTEGTQDDVEFE